MTNNSAILDLETERERHAPERTGLLNAPTGLATVRVAEAGDMRVLSQAISYHGRRVGTLRVADPLTQVHQAQSSLLRTFALVGLITLALALAAGIGIAAVIAAPLRRMARVAAAADAGDLSMRAGPVAARGEVRVLAESFDRMLERLDELDRLVGEMLTLASAEAGQLVEPRQIELSDFFEDVCRDLPLFGDRDFRVEAVGGTLQGDPERLTQVLRNLVRNAVTHTELGDQIAVAAHAIDGRLEITVGDTGSGIPAGQLEHIFERFYRGDQSRPRDSGGSGLGLAIARAIVEAHGGQIRAESRPGEGATFHIELPGYSP